MKAHRGSDSQEIITRRDLLKGAAYTTVGLALGLDALRSEAAEEPKPITKDIIVRADSVMDGDAKVYRTVLEAMLDRGMRELSGEMTVDSAWKKYIRTEDSVGVKIS